MSETTTAASDLEILTTSNALTESAVTTSRPLRPVLQLGESAVSILVTFIAFTAITVGTLCLMTSQLAAGTNASQSSSDDFWSAVALFAVPTIAIGGFLILLLGFPLNYVIGLATSALPAGARIAANFFVGWLFASALIGLAFLVITPSKGNYTSLLLVMGFLGIVPGLTAAVGTALSHLLFRPLNRASRGRRR